MPTQQIRAMIDTNVYEFLYKEHLDDLKNLIDSNKFIIYGCRVVRAELREIPQEIKYEGRNFRNALLSLYDRVAGKHSYPVEGVAEFIAEQYWMEYIGGIAKRRILDDFRIVAVASIHGLDVVVSEDEHSM